MVLGRYHPEQACCDQDHGSLGVKYTIFGNEEGNRYDMEMVVKLIISYLLKILTDASP